VQCEECAVRCGRSSGIECRLLEAFHAWHERQSCTQYCFSRAEQSGGGHVNHIVLVMIGSVVALAQPALREREREPFLFLEVVRL
jgi:hypothetical protein